MCPKRVVNWDECHPVSCTLKCRHHHMSRIQGMNIVRRESILLFDVIRTPATNINVNQRQAVPRRELLFTRNYWNYRNNLCHVATCRQTSQCDRQRAACDLPEIELRDSRVGRLADSSVYSIRLRFRVHARSFRHSPWTSPRRIEWPVWREVSIGRLCYLNFSRLPKQFT